MTGYRHADHRNDVGTVPGRRRCAFPAFLVEVLSFIVALSIPVLPAAAQPEPAGLFSAVDPSTRAETGEPPSPAAPDALILRQRLVTVDVGMLATARRDTRRAQPGATLNLNLFDDVVFPAIIDRTAPTRLGYALSGRLVGVDRSRMTLVVNGPLVVGSVDTPGATYRIRPAGAGTHVIHQIDRSRLPPEAEPVTTPDAELAGAGRRMLADVAAGAGAAGDSVGADDGSMIDVMVLYTPAARAGQGGRVAVEMLIDQFVDEANQAYQHSGVIQRINLVHVEEIEHTEGTVYQDAELERRAEVVALRDVYAADVVHFVINTPNSYCGIANLMNRVSHDFESRAFGYTDYRCGGITFVHELGHNMGLNHDRHAERPGGLTNTPFPYSYGYVNQRAFEPGARRSGRWMTLMSYHDQCGDAGISCTKLLRFSNPEMTWRDDPMGIPGDGPSTEVTGPSDARRTLNETRMTVANFRRSSARTAGCTYVTTPARQFVESGGGTFSIAVTTRPGCSWTATSGAEFVSVTRGVGGAGSGMVEYRVAANGGSPRIGTLTVAGEPFQVEQVGPVDQGVCGRTALVRDAILETVADVSTTGGAYCWDVTAADLSGIQWLDVLGQGEQRLSELRAGDLAGLTDLRSLSLVNHNLTAVPSGLFAGLAKLRRLWLVDNRLLTALPGRLFSDLSNLEHLYLYGNSLSELPANAFVGLSGVQSIDLAENGLETVPPGVFDGLSSLKDLDAADNRLRTLPAGIFAGLPGLEILRLQRNEFATLPVGIFAGMHGLQGFFLTGNPGSPFQLTLELARSNGGIVVGLAEGAPFDMAVGLSATGGTLSANVATLSTGRTVSEEISVIPHENARATVVSLGPAPPIPAGTCTRIVPCYSGLRIAVGRPFTFANRPFIDHVIMPGVTPVKAVHFTQLRTRIDEVRAALGLGRHPWTDPDLSPGVTRVRLVHLLELRSALGAAYAAAGRSAPSWSDASPTAGTTPIRAAHLMELRAAVAVLE